MALTQQPGAYIGADGKWVLDINHMSLPDDTYGTGEDFTIEEIQVIGRQLINTGEIAGIDAKKFLLYMALAVLLLFAASGKAHA